MLNTAPKIIIIILVVLIFGGGIWFLVGNLDNNDIGEPAIIDEEPDNSLPQDEDEDEVTVGQLKFDNITEQNVIDALQESELPIGEVEIFTEETDPENLLGAPEQYIGKAIWEDLRIEQTESIYRGGRVEVFFSEEDLQIRMDAVSETVNDFIFTHKNIIVYLDSDLTEEQVEEYEQVIKALE